MTERDHVPRTPTDDPNLKYLRLSAQRALLGNIGIHVRAVAVSYRGQTIVFDGLMEPEASDQEREDLEDAATDLIADYPSPWVLEVSIRGGEDDLPQGPSRVFQHSSGQAT